MGAVQEAGMVLELGLAEDAPNQPKGMRIGRNGQNRGAVEGEGRTLQFAGTKRAGRAGST